MLSLDEWKRKKKNDGEWLPYDEYMKKKESRKKEELLREVREIERKEGNIELRDHRDKPHGDKPRGDKPRGDKPKEKHLKRKNEEENDTKYVEYISDSEFDEFYKDHVSSDSDEEIVFERKKKKIVKKKSRKDT